jgi:GTPase
LFERPEGGERAIIVQIGFPGSPIEQDLAEFEQLALSATATIVGVVTGVRQSPEVKYFVGKGKAEEIRTLVSLNQAEIVLVNHELTPSQERNLERLFQCRVIDRSGLILDIFANRARTFEGKLQVELAQLQHLSTRLIRGWTHLERQKGGIGLRGPGETQLETDRRLIRERIKSINKRLQKVRSQRNQNRRARQKALMPTISIVGYTNAGKSTLFNSLTGEDIFTANQLFATLDPTMRKIELPGAGNAIVTDTVGFIRQLPHDLVEAFSATLEEAREANLLLHVIDISSPTWRDEVDAVDSVLAEIGAATIPSIHVYNKIDCMAEYKPHIDNRGEHTKVWLSAANRLGLENLLEAIAKHLYGDPVYRTLCLEPSQGKLRAELYKLDAILSETTDGEGNWVISIRISKKDFERLFDDEKPKA